MLFAVTPRPTIKIMTFLHSAILLVAGLAGGFVAGILGVGGGIIFAPVLFFYYQSIGIGPSLITPLTLGSSLLCIFIAAGSSTWVQHRKGTVVWKTAAVTGLFSAVAVFLMVRYVTTQPWYDGRVFQIVFSILLLIVVVRMLRGNRQASEGKEVKRPGRTRWPFLAGIGSAAGVVSPAAGIGGGIVLVPTYHHVLDLRLKRSFGTSSATIVFISLAGILNYALFGWAADTPATAVGYVDVGRALLLAVPALVSARWGVRLSHSLNTRWLRWGFAVLATVVAVRLLLNV